MTTTRGHAEASAAGSGPADGLDAGLWAWGRRGRPATVCGGRAAPPGGLSAETDGQAVPRVGVFFPPPAGAVVLVVPPVAHRRPHAPSAHRAVAAPLAVVVGALHGQFHAAVLVIQVRAGQGVGRAGRQGGGRHVVDGFQRGCAFQASLSAGHGAHP